ncbi:uncharacterized protein LOC143280275 [Babylonia areolata]|uniref:uncharacterized protein LOC143280275 n=1 Tax=Babylonia areolata TaxID=304850 RepID=UPI003FD34234
MPREARSQLSTTTLHVPIARDTTKAGKALIRRTIKTAVDNGHVPFEALHAVMKEPRESLLYILTKIHKVNNPGRPIVSACACPTALISAFLDSVFKPMVAALPTFVKDTNHTLNPLNDFSFPADCTEKQRITMDIVSLYTNIPHQEGMLAVKHFLPKSSLHLHFPTILMTELVLTLNSFSFDQDHFQQQSGGVAMGYIKEQAFSQYTGVRPALYKRFIDDCLGIATGPLESLQAFTDFMSNFHPALKFSHTISNSSVPFLDIRCHHPTHLQLSDHKCIL